MTNYTDILKNEHFNNLANLIRRVFWSPQWRREHATVPFFVLWKNMDAVTGIDSPPWNKSQVVAAFTDLLTHLVEADPRLSYSTADYEWLVGVIDDDKLNKVTISLWKAYAVAPLSLLTPAEAADETDTSESSWRNRAAAGEIPGAFKKGKQWLIPRSAVEPPATDEDDQGESENA